MKIHKLTKTIIRCEDEMEIGTYKTLKMIDDEATKLGDCIKMLIEFIPEGWEMPLGWSSLVEQARMEIK
jgi:hypothetical protein